MLEMKIKIEADVAILKAIDKLTTALEKNAVNISVSQDTPAPVAPVAAPVTPAPVPPVTMPPATVVPTQPTPAPVATPIEAAVCPDGRVRGLLQFYGANRTGRWAGRLVQVQNLPRTYTEPLPLARELVEHRKLDALRLIYGSVPDTLSQLIRTAFVAPEGHVLIDADFSAIEARVISWLAGEQWRLEVFRTHGKIYEASASQMFGVPIELIKKGNPEYALRQKGKVAELALGYQGSTGALINMGALDMGIPEEDLPDIVSRWREANKRIRDLWYSMDNAAVQVITQGGSVGINGLLLAREYDYNQGTDCFTIQLPSGRKLYYVSPGIGENQWGNPSISYMGMDQKTKRWKRIETYGGKLVENCVQAIARDCLADTIERLEAAGLPVIFHIHDEVVIDITPCFRASRWTMAVSFKTTMVWKRPAAGKESAPPFTTATRTHHMSVAATRT